MPIALILSNWRLILEVVIVGILVAYGVTMRTQRDISRAEYSEFRREVAIAAQAAAEQALKKTIADEKRKEEADADNLRLRSNLDLLTRRLRDARAGSNFVPPAAANSSSPANASFDREALERALQRLDDEVQGLITEGDRAIVDLESAKRWAKER